MKHLLYEASKRGAAVAYLFSKDTGRFFEKLGFLETEVHSAAAALQGTAQVLHYNTVGWYDDERAFRLELVPESSDP